MAAVTRIAAVALLLLATACDSAPPAPRKSGTGELRTDLDPLVKRFPALAGATKAVWMSGTLGDDRVPGPSTYWIDAIVTLPQTTITDGDVQGTETPAVVEGLRGHLPAGPYRTGKSLDAMFSSQGWQTTAYLVENTVVLVATGQ
ncbi:hypothetical protein V5P93_000099 [Actinokineospora auranticolor]|uniref:Lipoprotein n=1 Tax=Actinokineospora auranticolor TaxID=155976 RepID=A0A2S6GBT9_9PSEU|nr:hypothetical protein [Actinokineospora auranticolor]PPK61740.1 hypothetical protein CLV40_13937 [Actinokineospora auranticolor]